MDKQPLAVHGLLRSVATTIDPPSLHPLLLTPREAARLLSLSERTLWTLTHRGELPAVRVGRAVRYDVSDLRRWVETTKAAGGTR